MELATLKAFENEVRKEIPGFEVRYKDTSWSQKLLGLLTFPFNPLYMTRYTTTVYPYVYFPTQADYESTAKSSFTVLAHEMVHLVDTKKKPLWMRLSYALPQVAGLLPLLIYGVLSGHNAWVLGVIFLGYILGCLVAKKSIAAFWCLALGGLIAGSLFAVLLTGWLSAILFAGLALFAPWPSPWRSNWELRGYSMTLAIMQWSFGSVPDLLKQSVLRNFTTSSYFFMSWSPSQTDAKLTAAITSAQNGTLQKDTPYTQVYSFMAANDLLKK